MKLKKYNIFEADKNLFDVDNYDKPERNFHEEIESDDDDDIEDVGFEDVGDDTTQNDVMENLASTLRKMIKLTISDSYVWLDESEECINVQFVLKRVEKIASIMKIMDLLKKISNETLIEYDSEFDLWETKEGDPLIHIKFFYDEGTQGKSEPLPF